MFAVAQRFNASAPAWLPETTQRRRVPRRHQLGFDFVTTARPILKWVGGKTRILSELEKRLPDDIANLRHVEPFVGGAALFFRRAPRRALLGDVNPQLMATYRCVQLDAETLIEHLTKLEKVHNEAMYYAVRALYNAASTCSETERSAQFIYLNKTCYNGLHRVNRRGEFNVPVGRYDAPCIVDAAQLRAARRALQDVQLRTGDFCDVLVDAGRGDFVYLDSPYDVEPGARGFTSYASSPFGPKQQDLQAEVFRELDRRGCKVLLSNSDTVANRDRYAGFVMEFVNAPRAINCKAAGRGAVREIVVRNYE